MSKLNMDHGFIRYITKNQWDRDKYEQECRQKQHKLSTGNKPRRPPQAIYTPPSRSPALSSPSSEGSERTQENKPNLVQHSKVRVCFTDEHGQTHDFMVHKSDDPVEVARQFCARMGYIDVYIQPLAQRIVEECSVYFSPATQ
ncbi:UPF0561 protein C2orf68 homolog [Watersipora subatra]|uniref:UPF0561 protein C2orf68 homolog n=1 Tax=Watersipora subatra TaxID=2589382 RepID=UPI00355C6EEA